MQSRYLATLHLVAFVVFFTIGPVYGLMLSLFILSMQMHSVFELIENEYQ